MASIEYELYLFHLNNLIPLYVQYQLLSLPHSVQYNVTEGSYVSDPDDGYLRIREAQQMIESLHSRGIRVVLDVVFNHMHDVNQNALDPLFSI